VALMRQFPTCKTGRNQGSTGNTCRKFCAGVLLHILPDLDKALSQHRNRSHTSKMQLQAWGLEIGPEDGNIAYILPTKGHRW
jgi:hypothetical protein